jgi:hypothetical protein
LYDATSGNPHLWRTYDNDVELHPVIACGFFHLLPEIGADFLKEDATVLQGSNRKILLSHCSREIDYKEFELASDGARKTYENKKPLRLGMAGVFDAGDDDAPCADFCERVLDDFMHTHTKELMEGSPEGYRSYHPRLDRMKDELETMLTRGRGSLQEGMLKKIKLYRQELPHRTTKRLDNG